MFEKLINYIMEKPLLSAEDNMQYEQLLESECEDSEADINKYH